MKEVKNCKRCNMIFSTFENEILCAKCRIEDDMNYKKIRDYLYDNPGTNIYDLSLKFKISINQIKHYIQNGGIQTK